jgi:translation elongation factor EF-Tu-like GTPase
MEAPSFRRPHQPPDFEARIAYLATADGGPRGPVYSGLRAVHNFGVSGTLNDAMHEYLDGGFVLPGCEARALVWLLAPEFQKGRLHPGFKFTVQDGPEVVGHGEVLAVLNKELARDP